MLWFLHFDLAQSPIYGDILASLKNGALLLDLGCGLGQDIRRLVHDGAPQKSILGLDLNEQFIDLGFELFQDRTSMGCTFIIQDFFDQTKCLEKWTGRFNVINSGYFMHLWDWEGQVKVAKRMISILALHESCIVTGVHFGSENTGLWEKVPADNDPIFLHDSASLTELWQQVGKQTQTEISVWTTTEHNDDHTKLDPKGHCLRWYVKLSRK